MTYISVSELPSEVRRAFTDTDAEEWLKAYNKAIMEICPDDTDKAREYAWTSCKELPSSRYVKSNVSTEVVDKEGEVSDVKEYVEKGQDFVRDGGQVTRNHSNTTIGTVWKVEEGVDAKTGKPCVIASINFFRGRSTYERGWRDFKSGRLRWSIASMTHRQFECKDKMCYHRLHPTQWFELALVNFPRNPITYDIELNESAKGMDFIDFHDSEEESDKGCPIREKYDAFKERMSGFGIESHIVDGGVILLKGDISDDAQKDIDETYPSFYSYKTEEEGDGKLTFLIPQVDDSDDFLESMVDLFRDEQEAIANYNTVLKSLERGDYLDTEDFEKAKKAFEEVIRDEENHIGVILRVIKEVSPEVYSGIAEGMSESEGESDKGCPAGQHEHAGIVGCHDVFRKHSIDYKTNPSQYLDLTDENIDVNAIKRMDTPVLKELVIKIASVLPHFSRKEVDEFMSKTAGKGFVLAYLELKRRSQGVEHMSEEEVQKTPEVPSEPVEAEKGLLSDPQTSLVNIATVLASLVNAIDGISARLIRMETSLAKQEEDKADISSAILTDVGKMGEAETEKEVAPPAVPTEEKKEEPAAETAPAPPAPPAKAETEEDAKEKVEDEPEKSEDKSEDESKEDDKESKEEESEEKPKDEKEDEKKEKGAGDSESEQGEEFTDPDGSGEEKLDGELVEEDASKGCSAVEEVKADEVVPIEDAPAEVAPIEEVKAESPAEIAPDEPVSESIKEDAQDAPAEPAAEPWYPMPRGDDNVDFRNAILKRKEEARAKGVELSIGNDASSSLAGAPSVQATQGGNAQLVYPSNHIQTYGGAVGGSSSSISEVMKHMGERPETFLKYITGE